MTLIPEPWPTGFLRDEQKEALAAALTRFAASDVARWIDDIDGWCRIYAWHTTAAPRDTHREALRRLHGMIRDLSDALEIRFSPQQFADGSFAEHDIAAMKALGLKNDEFANAKHSARIALGALTGMIERGLPFFWRDDSGRISYVPPIGAQSRKGGRPTAAMLTELVRQCAASFRIAFDAAPSGTRTGTFYAAMQIVCGAVGGPKSAPDRLIQRALNKPNNT